IKARSSLRVAICRGISLRHWTSIPWDRALVDARFSSRSLEGLPPWHPVEQTARSKTLCRQLLVMIILAGTIIFIFRGGTTLLFLTAAIIVVPLTTGTTAIMITLSVNTETHLVATAAMFFNVTVIAFFSVINA